MSGTRAQEDVRWENYRRANAQRPDARERELRRLFELLNPAEGERVWEAGTGNGYLTLPLARAVGPRGLVLTTDVTPGNIGHVEALNLSLGLPITTRLLGAGEALGEEGAFDAVASIATLHHYDNRTEGTGERGRRAALREFYRALRPGGRAVIADVLHGTITQRYFDAIDDPRYCAPHGHPHDFFSHEGLEEAARDMGFADVAVAVERVPWQFADIASAGEFVHTIHNAQVSPKESLALAQKVLGLTDAGGHVELGWELFYLTAKKP
jgi:SAM-dependent methyltransferase